MYNTQILDKYNFVFINYDTNESLTKLSVPSEYRLTNTIVSYLDFKGFLHIELFVGTEEDITDELWVDETNWVSTKLIYHKCFNEEWDTDFATTAVKVPCPVRFRGNVLHIQNVPAYDTCGEIYYEDKTYRYKCICCDDCKYGNIDNWEEYDFQLIIDDIVKIVTDLMEQANDIDYGILTPDEEMIKNLIKQLFNEWLNDEKLTQIINAWLEGWDITSIVESWLGDNINDILNNYFNGEGNDILTQIINDLLDDKIGEYLDSIVTYIRDNERVIANALARHEQAITELQNA